MLKRRSVWLPSPTRLSFSTRATISASAAALMLTTTACIPSLKQVFVSQTYPEAPENPPPEDVSLVFQGVLVPMLVNGYRQPGAVGGCFARLANDPETLDSELDALGACLVQTTVTAQTINKNYASNPPLSEQANHNAERRKKMCKYLSYCVPH